MNDSTFQDPRLIAPCGIPCEVCYAHLRAKNKCPGCRLLVDPYPNFRQRCKIANCEKLAETKSGLCYECDTIPCKRLKELDKRYRISYNTSLIQNLAVIKEKGMDTFLAHEKKHRTCQGCGLLISIHSNGCSTC